MEGSFREGWFKHPTLGLIRIFIKGPDWVYVCYTSNGEKALSKERPLDSWTWALSEPSGATH
ncbi:hypothetical protein ACHHRT_01005 [Desulfurivibrio sp. D14AmB]|uniref:hypothetical protein n=1 Tax=Desulfurivibrio sp. D14AmB TaxID=3374370 RepID=UPI00376EFFA5